MAAVKEYLAASGHTSDKAEPLFRPLRNFSSQAGLSGAFWTDSLWRIVMKYAADIGIEVEGFGPHSLQATAGSNALEHGADIAAVSERLGHASVTTTRPHDKRTVRLENSPPFRGNY